MDNQEEKKLTEPVSLEEFREQIRQLAEQRHLARVEDFLKNGTLSMRSFEGARKFKSSRRAIRRGLMSLYGDVYPNRPFSNRKRGKGTETDERRKVHEQYKHNRKETGEDSNT